jgi:hypothetical protein
MKIARMSLSAAALVVNIVGAFAFSRPASRFLAGTLYTIGGNQHVNCSRLPTGTACPVNAYTKVNHTQITGSKSTGQ